MLINYYATTAATWVGKTISIWRMEENQVVFYTSDVHDNGESVDKLKHLKLKTHQCRTFKGLLGTKLLQINKTFKRFLP